MRGIAYAFVIAAALILSGCFKGDNDDRSNLGLSPTKAAVYGYITDLNGTPISGATVKMGSLTSVTNSRGEYTFDNVDPSERETINVYHPDYLSNSRIVKTLPGKYSDVTIKIDKPHGSGVLDSALGGKVSDGNASVTLPPNSVVDAEGNPYNGDVKVLLSYYPIGTKSGRASFPGSFEGLEGNESFPIISYGFMNVELKDRDGNRLNLAPGKSATLLFPADEYIGTPSSIPLWYYDEKKGYWIQEGNATYDSANKMYEGSVTHFTSWNLDVKGQVASLVGCVVDESGNRVDNALVQFRSANWDSLVVPTDENGTISVYNVLAGTPLNMIAFKNIDGTQYFGEYPEPILLADGEHRELSSCIQLMELTGSSDEVTVIGSIDTTPSEDFKYAEPSASNNITVSIIDINTRRTVASKRVEIGSDFNISFRPTDSLIYSINYSKTVILLPYKEEYNISTLRFN